MMAMVMPLISSVVSMATGSLFTHVFSNKAGLVIIQKKRRAKKQAVVVTMVMWINLIQG